jgi:hypothetical protein
MWLMIWPCFEEVKKDLDEKKPKMSYDATKNFQIG